MLTKIEITNFKNFNEKFVFDLTNTKSFEFNKECVKNGVVNKALIYGPNGIGKSNLGFAIFDLISHMTDKENGSQFYNNYLNANNKSGIAEFSYEFKFKEGLVKYSYTKKDKETLVSENLIINNIEYASINRDISTIIYMNIEGAETLKNDMGDSNISIISYIKQNSIREDNQNNRCFNEFIKFVNNMLFFRSIQTNNYIGYTKGDGDIPTEIIKKGHLEDFENFLNDAGIECKLGALEIGDRSILTFKFGDKHIPFYDIASSGTQSLALFYFWFMRLKESNEVSFVFIDEFDAYYHHLLATAIIKKLKEIDSQVIISTHNISLMTNELLRPDCYFLLKKNEIKSLSHSTVKELREAHNIEKMYKAGSFE